MLNKNLGIAFALILTLLSGTAHADALPKPAPVAPVPNIDTTPTKIGIDGNHVIRPVPSANGEIYKKVPLDKSKVGGYIKKMPKGGFLELGIILGITALSEAVDYLIDTNRNVVRFQKLQCKTIGYGNFTTNTKEQFIARLKSEVFKDNFSSFTYDDKTGAVYRKYNIGYGDVSVMVGRCSPIPQPEIPLDELADKIIDAGKKGNPNAVKVINDWADDEIKTNPDLYPNVQPNPNPSTVPSPNPDVSPSPRPVPAPHPLPSPAPSPLPNPNADPKTVPSPVPNPNPNTRPSPNIVPSDDPNAQPNPNTDPNTTPNPTTNPNEQPFKFELPAFCSWAGKVCDFVDWVKKDDTDKDTQIDIKQPEIPSIDTDIKLSGQCPKDIVIGGSFAGKEFTFFTFEWSRFCEWLGVLKTIIIAMASYTAIKIVGGVNVSD